MEFIDYGISALTRDVITREIPAGEVSDLAELLKHLMRPVRESSGSL